MGKLDPAVTAYIAKSQPFARPILEHLRALVHAACPDVSETIKWGFPNFEYRGLLCNMAAFKAHAAFGFWKQDLVLKGTVAPKGAGRDGAGSFGRLTSVADLPPRATLVKLVKVAMTLNDSGAAHPTRSKPAPKPPLRAPAWFTTPLRAKKAALATWTALSPSHQREYLEWLTEAKTEATRAKRLATTLEWLAEGKSRNWKYEKKR